MSAGTRRACAVLVTLFFSVHLSACYKKVAVKPTELPKVNQSYTKTAGTAYTGQGTVTVTESSVIKLERTDGRLYELKGDADVLVRPKGGEQLFFKHPIGAKVKDGTLKIKSKNYAEKSFKIDNLQSTKVRDYDQMGTMWLLGGIGGAVGLVGSLIILSATPSPSSY